MKKYLLFAFMICNTSFAFAGDSQCMYLNITITNKTPNTCHLVNTLIKYGELFHHSEPPAYILSGTTSYTFELHEIGYSSPDIILTYQCGEEKSITIESIQNPCMINNSIRTAVLSTTNMTASSQIERGSYYHNKQGAIYWTFY